jgi:hypothetical protein
MSISHRRQTVRLQLIKLHDLDKVDGASCAEQPGAFAYYLVQNLLPPIERYCLLEDVADFEQLLCLFPVIKGSGNKDFVGSRLDPKLQVRSEVRRQWSRRGGSPTI